MDLNISISVLYTALIRFFQVPQNAMKANFYDRQMRKQKFMCLYIHAHAGYALSGAISHKHAPSRMIPGPSRSWIDGTRLDGCKGTLI